MATMTDEEIKDLCARYTAGHELTHVREDIDRTARVLNSLANYFALVNNQRINASFRLGQGLDELSAQHSRILDLLARERSLMDDAKPEVSPELMAKVRQTLDDVKRDRLEREAADRKPVEAQPAATGPAKYEPSEEEWKDVYHGYRSAMREMLARAEAAERARCQAEQPARDVGELESAIFALMESVCNDCGIGPGNPECESECLCFDKAKQLTALVAKYPSVEAGR